jgi:alpha-glucosidase
MYFQKNRHPSNFSFANGHAHNTLTLGSKSVRIGLRDLGEDVFHVELEDAVRWPLDARTLPMLEDAFTPGTSRYCLNVLADGQLELTDTAGRSLLAGVAGACFGVCGSAWMLQLARTADMRFFGQGEKVTGLEKSGKRTKFWNADVWADHAMHTIEHGQADPQYAAIPYLLVRQGEQWVGILVDHPGAVFMDTGSNWFFFGKDDQNAPPAFWFGADQGVPAFYVIAGDSAACVTRRLQRLVGVTPLPPLWALGHHQSRWGYAGIQQLNRLDSAFTDHAFPNDGLWLDIDYMDAFRVFTTSPEHFGILEHELQGLRDKGRHIVPILDPGVKVQAGYDVADSGLAIDIFCHNPEGQPFVGFVWPGRTWFPDYSLPEARDWWATYCKAFRSLGFDGAWLDMNDPSTGAAELDDMLFMRGKWPHWAYHNQYATGMAQATRQGFLAARPDERPFLLTRSASAGASRFSAVWTGDNFSSWQHLRTSIHCSLNLALSGQPFNGPDVPGFGGHADKELAVAWYKAGCLFPFFRNHACAGTADQEPWAFGAEALEIIRHHVRLRYKLLPYLYQLWDAQAQHGAAVMRPLFHDFPNCDGVELDRIDDQFLIGPDILQAPVVHPGTQQRTVTLPGDIRWLDVNSGQFLRGGRCIHVTSRAEATPLYLREGCLIPMQSGTRTDNANDLADIELHAILGDGCTAIAHLNYVADDGLTYGYQRGARQVVGFTAQRFGNVLALSVVTHQSGWKALRVRLVGYDGVQNMECTVNGVTQTPPISSTAWTCSGSPLAVAISAPISFGLP